MSISIDSLLGQAQKINKRRTSDAPLSTDIKNTQPDQVEINSKMNTRLAAIDNDLRSVQDTMTKNQVLVEGLKSLIEQQSRGDSAAMKETVGSTTYKGQAILAEYLGDEQMTESFLTSRLRNARESLNKNYNEATKLAIEFENISAVNPSTAAKASDIIATSPVEGVATHNPDTVYRLTR